jgi:hypothetical protein
LVIVLQPTPIGTVGLVLGDFEQVGQLLLALGQASI